jgi:hypothetical protein
MSAIIPPVVPSFMANVAIERPLIRDSPEFQILGDFCQVLHLKLKPGQKVQVEPGVMCYMVRLPCALRCELLIYASLAVV